PRNDKITYADTVGVTIPNMMDAIATKIKSNSKFPPVKLIINLEKVMPKPVKDTAPKIILAVAQAQITVSDPLAQFSKAFNIANRFILIRFLTQLKSTVSSIA